MEDTRRGKSRVSLVKKAAKMDRAIWSDLPKELLQLVFARLPLAGIFRLRCLTKQWNRIVNSHGFKKVCADAHPKMFAVITSDDNFSAFGDFTVRLYDLRSDTCHAMGVDTGYPRRNSRIFNACDGGLVCFACMALEEQSVSVLVLVCNPLTRELRALPLHSHHKRPPEMLHLVVDRVSKCYEVLIVSSTDRNGGGRLVAEVFHSKTGAWTTANLTSEKRYFPGFRDVIHREIVNYSIVYDCAGGYFLEIPAVADLLRDLLRDCGNCFISCRCALVHDRLFALCWKEPIEGGREWFFAEFQFLESGARWLKVKDHCVGTKFGWSNVRSVLACKGFVLVVTETGFGEWSFDLSTGEWHTIYPEDGRRYVKCDLMCELQWNVIP